MLPDWTLTSHPYVLRVPPLGPSPSLRTRDMSPDPPLHEVNRKNHTPIWIQLPWDVWEACPSLPLQPPPPHLGVYMLYCAKAIILTPPVPPSLFCRWTIPHHFTYTLQPLSSGDCPGSNCGFCACGPPPPFSKEPRPLVSCHHITACRPRGLMTGSIVHENTIIALGSIATVWMAFKTGKGDQTHAAR